MPQAEGAGEPLLEDERRGPPAATARPPEGFSPRAAVRPHSTAGVVSHRGRDYIEHRAPGLLTVLALAGALGVAPGTLVDDLPLDGPAARDEADGR